MPAYNTINPPGFMPNAAWSPQPVPNVYQPPTSAAVQQDGSNLRSK